MIAGRVDCGEVVVMSLPHGECETHVASLIQD
jgi:hypothetical protein